MIKNRFLRKGSELSLLGILSGFNGSCTPAHYNSPSDFVYARPIGQCGEIGIYDEKNTLLREITTWDGGVWDGGGCNDIKALGFSPDGRLLVTVYHWGNISPNSEISAFSVENGELIDRKEVSGFYHLLLTLDNGAFLIRPENLDLERVVIEGAVDVLLTQTLPPPTILYVPFDLDKQE